MQLVRELSGTAPRAPPSDPRVLAAMETIRQRVDQTVALPEVATQGCESVARPLPASFCVADRHAAARNQMSSCRCKIDACLHLIPWSGQSSALPHQ